MQQAQPSFILASPLIRCEAWWEGKHSWANEREYHWSWNVLL